MNPMVAVDPRYRFGWPQVGGVETCVIAGVYRAGETDIDLLAEDYGLTTSEVCVALAWEGVYVDHRSDPDVVEWCAQNPGRCSDKPIHRGKPIPARGLPRDGGVTVCKFEVDGSTRFQNRDFYVLAEGITIEEAIAGIEEDMHVLAVPCGEPQPRPLGVWSYGADGGAWGFYSRLVYVFELHFPDSEYAREHKPNA